MEWSQWTNLQHSTDVAQHYNRPTGAAHPCSSLADAAQLYRSPNGAVHPYRSRCAPLQESTSRCTVHTPSAGQQTLYNVINLQKFKWRCAPLQKVYWRCHTFRRSTTHFQDVLLFDEIHKNMHS